MEKVLNLGYNLFNIKLFSHLFELLHFHSATIKLMKIQDHFFENSICIFSLNLDFRKSFLGKSLQKPEMQKEDQHLLPKP